MKIKQILKNVFLNKNNKKEKVESKYIDYEKLNNLMKIKTLSNENADMSYEMLNKIMKGENLSVENKEKLENKIKIIRKNLDKYGFQYDIYLKDSFLLNDSTIDYLDFVICFRDREISYGQIEDFIDVIPNRVFSIGYYALTESVFYFNPKLIDILFTDSLYSNYTGKDNSPHQFFKFVNGENRISIMETLKLINNITIHLENICEQLENSDTFGRNLLEFKMWKYIGTNLKNGKHLLNEILDNEVINNLTILINELPNKYDEKLYHEIGKYLFNDISDLKN